MPTTRHPPSNGRHPEARAYSPARRGIWRGAPPPADHL